jgi:hypothetical protein
MATTNGDARHDELMRQLDELRKSLLTYEQTIATLMEVTSEYVAATKAVRAGISSGATDFASLADRADIAERKVEQIIKLARQHGFAPNVKDDRAE